MRRGGGGGRRREEEGEEEEKEPHKVRKEGLAEQTEGQRKCCGERCHYDTTIL